MGKISLILPALLAFGLVGCRVPTSISMEGTGGRNSYNMVVQKSNSEELLLNLVRLRYYDAPLFLELSNITTQVTYKTTAGTNFSIPGFNHDSPVGFNGEFSWQDQPTIQYTPLEGQEFAAQMMKPIELSTIQLLVYSGWDVDRLFRLVIQSFANQLNMPLSGAPAPVHEPHYKSFFVAIKLLRELQLQGHLLTGVKITEDEHGRKESLQIGFPKDNEVSQKLAALLPTVTDFDRKYVLSMLKGFTPEGKIGVMSRSLLSCMYYVSLGVEVPKVDIENGAIAMPEGWSETSGEWNKVAKELLTVQTCDQMPSHASVAVKYRGHWFYIADNDLNSKRTFALLMQLFNLQAVEQKLPPPILTLPLG